MSTGRRLGAPAPSPAPFPPDPSVKQARRLVVPNLRPRVAVIAGIAPAQKPRQTQRVRGRALQGIRRRHFQQEPLCVRCKAKGRVVAATQVDHTRPLWDGGADADSNRQGLCDACHDEKTAVEASLRATLR